MVRSPARAIVLLLVLPLIAVACLSQLANAQSGTDFLAEQREREARIAAYYANVQMTVTKTSRLLETDAPVTKQHFFYRVNNRIRLEGHEIVKVGDAAVPEERVRVWITNPNSHSFRVRRTGAAAKFVLDALTQNHNQLKDDIFLSAGYSIAAYGLLDITVCELLSGPDVVIDKVEPPAKDGIQATVVRFRQIKGPDGKPANAPGWISFLNDRHWVVSEWTLGKNVLARGRVEYHDGDGIPIVKSYHRWTEQKGVKTSIEDYTVKVVKKTTPASMFTLESFGIHAGGRGLD